MTLSYNKILKNRGLVHLAMASSIAAMFSFAPAQAEEFETPEVLMIGDSQLSFGTGLEMIRFFDNFKNRCDGHVSNKAVLDKINVMKKTLIGARSTTLRSWSTEKGGAYDKLCEKDPDWGVNASIWGHMRDKTRKYIQIGETENFDFCKSSTPPVKAMFEEGYDPKLLLINVLGNAASKWSGSPKGAELDLKGFLELIPEDLPCVYIATMPSYTKKRNDRRFKAQNNLKKAMDKLGNRCTFVNTLDANTIGAIQSHAQYFRKNEKGKVKDPFHPQQNAAELVLKMKEKQICQAVIQAVLPHWNDSILEVAAVSSDEKTDKMVQASLVQEVSQKLYKDEAIKVDSKSIAVDASLQTTAEKATSVKKVAPVILMVKTLPDGETIENYKMANQTYVGPMNALDEKSNDDFAILEKKVVETTLQMPDTFIRGSVDMHFSDGDAEVNLVRIKVDSN